MTQNVLDVSGLTKQFGRPASTRGESTRGGFIAVNNISFSVKEGEIVGLLGPNGAGKTTTIQMLLNLMLPTKGAISYFGKSLFTDREEILQRINSSSGYARMPWRITAWENLDVYGYLYQVPDHRKKIEELADRFEATDLLPMLFQDLSSGQMTRISLIKAFLNDPEMLLLDEPTASLDPDIAESIRSYILGERKKRNMSILVTSHNMTEVEEMCDRVIFLNHGKIFAVDTPQGLARRSSMSKLELMVEDGLKRLIEMAKNEHFTYLEKNRFITITLPEEKIASFLTAIGSRGVVLTEIEIVRPSLEDFFLSVIHGRHT